MIEAKKQNEPAKPRRELKLSSDLLERMIKAAALAPSAENTQPWHFIINEKELTICLDRSRAMASDVDCMLDLTGLGACTENAVIEAREAGYEPTVTFVAERSQLQQTNGLVPVAKLTCSKAGEADPLACSITPRCTSRRMKSAKIPQSQLDKLSAEIDEISGVQIDWVTGGNAWRELAQLVGIGNRIRFEYQPFHQEFYENVRITPAEVNATRDGLDLATLQLPLGVSAIMAFLKRWPRMRVANLLGFSRGVARQAAAEMRCSGAIGILTVDSATYECFLNGGRALERIWLASTSAKLGFHPAAALAVFLAYAERTDGSRLLPKHQRMAEDMQQRFYRLYPHLSGRTVQMIFRVGHANKPKVRSLRRHVNDVLELSSATQ